MSIGTFEVTGDTVKEYLDALWRSSPELAQYLDRWVPDVKFRSHEEILSLVLSELESGTVRALRDIISRLAILERDDVFVEYEQLRAAYNRLMGKWPRP